MSQKGHNEGPLISFDFRTCKLDMDCIGDDIGIASMSSLELCNLSTIKAASNSLGIIRMHDISSRTSIFYRLESLSNH